MVFKFAYLLPIAIGFWVPITFIITYIVSTSSQRVNPLFPYISDTGTWSPESCIFGLMLNTAAIMMAMIVYIRYRQVREVFDKNELKPHIKKLNFHSLTLGLIASFGIALVGNFQETNVISVHLLGACLGFGLGTIYLMFQTYISWKIFPTFGSKSVNVARTFCTIACCVSNVTTTTFGVASLYEFKGDLKDITKWGPNDGGYELHLVSTAAEWSLALFTIFYLVLFTKEFKIIGISEPLITIKAV